jgi:hypothetical protein
MTTWAHNKLWAAVLAQAIVDSKRDSEGNKNHKRNRSSAIFWLYKSKQNGPGSFIWICEALELSIDFVREYVREWDGIRFDTFGDLL